MLLDRKRPNEQQGFGDYLSELGNKNGFSNASRFKIFLANSSKKNYYIYSGNKILMSIISGLFIELGLDQANFDGIQRPQCFACMHRSPKRWSWWIQSELQCHQIISNSKLCDQSWDRFQVNRESYCGLMMCSAKRLGLNFSIREEGLYYADIQSRRGAKIYASHKAYTIV